MRTPVPAPIIWQKGLPIARSKLPYVAFATVVAAAVSIIAYLVIWTPVHNFKVDDRRCTDAYGARWDHQNRQTENNGADANPPRQVCINIDTKEERPVK